MIASSVLLASLAIVSVSAAINLNPINAASSAVAAGAGGMRRYLGPDGPIQNGVSAIGGLPMRGGELINRGLSGVSNGFGSVSDRARQMANGARNIPVPSMDSVRNLVPSADGIRNLVPSTDGIRNLVPSADGVRNLVPSADGIRNLVPNVRNMVQSPASNVASGLKGAIDSKNDFIRNQAIRAAEAGDRMRSRIQPSA